MSNIHFIFGKQEFVGQVVGETHTIRNDVCLMDGEDGVAFRERFGWHHPSNVLGRFGRLAKPGSVV